MKYPLFLITGITLLLTGCAGVKSSFDCDATTSDTCMTMTRANELAKEKAARQSVKQGADGLPGLVSLPAAAPVSSRTAPPAINRLPSSVPDTRPVSAPVSALTAPGQSAPRRTAVVPVSAGTDVRFACASTRCDSPGVARPQRSAENTATVWIAPWVDSESVFHQPGRVSFIVSPGEWVLPAQIQ